MDHNFYSIVEKLAILEGRITPKHEHIAESKQKKPALFNNLKKAEEDFTPGVGGVEFAEEKSDDVLSKVKASLADYLKSAEDSIKQDKDLIAKKKQDLDLKKKELKDLELQQKKQEVEEAIPMGLEEGKLNVGDPIIVTAPNEFDGMTGEVVEFSPSGKFVIVRLYNHDEEVAMHLSDVEFNQYADDEDNDYDDEENIDIDLNKHGIDPEGDYEEELAEEPNQTPAQGEAPAGLTDPTYAESVDTAPVKTVNVPKEDVGIGSGGGGSVLVEIHGDERSGFKIKRAGKELPTVFKSLEECEIALEMYMAKQKAKHNAEQSADYIEEK